MYSPVCADPWSFWSSCQWLSSMGHLSLSSQSVKEKQEYHVNPVQVHALTIVLVWLPILHHIFHSVLFLQSDPEKAYGVYSVLTGNYENTLHHITCVDMYCDVPWLDPSQWKHVSNSFLSSNYRIWQVSTSLSPIPLCAAFHVTANSYWWL